MVVRAFMADDITGINKLLNNELGKEVNADELHKTVCEMMLDENYRIFVAEQSNEIVGFIGVHFGLAFEIKGKVMRIIALAVKETHQHRGIGTELLKAAENVLHKTKLL